MARKPRRATLIALLVVTSVLIAAWIHSHAIGWRSEWSNAKAKSGGRVVSLNGQLYLQRCSLQPTRLSAALSGEQEPTKMPDDFCVGSNPKGKHTLINIGKFPVPFADPYPRQLISLNGQDKTQNSKADGHWYANWHELLIAHWLAALLPAMLLATECRKWYLFRRESDASNDSPNGLC